ncbi:sporulation membrane protein YtrI [Aliibacillus thermotolerans]|uniref:Sporulation membrane protein YtrI n=1 Tax=Aliibacillus thermotolerans TaxID=1834418 RepID=A0ABW0U9U0_9BACI|nr:sporulation membrane protein YtrI [Aliibacillus thermotolerans]MDA3129815.1 hypothetical protein [Aliibacillus thermotolerans]
MRVPPYYKRPGWQRFFAGLFIGAIGGWCFFLFQFGSIHERLVIDLNKQKLQIEQQKEEIELLRSAEKERNEENERKLTIQNIYIAFTNEKEARLNELTLYELRQQVEDEIKFLKNKNIESVVEGKELIKKTIENKTYEIGDHHGYLQIEEMHIYSTLELHVKIIQQEEKS